MIKVRIRVSSETGDFAVVVCTESLRHAVRGVKERYPGSAVDVAFPIDPDCFFVEDTGRSEYVDLEVKEELSQPGEVIVA
jgi:hypothetical protein